MNKNFAVGIDDPTALASSLEIAVYEQLELVRAEWQRFETTAVASPHQSFDWVAAWHNRSHARRTHELRIVVGRDSTGRTVCILPFGIRRQHGFRVLEWLGGHQGNYASGLFCREFWERRNAFDFEAFWSRVLARMGRVDAVHLAAQPADIAGLSNPFMALPTLPAAGMAHWFPLDRDWEAHYRRAFSSNSRRKLRRSERNLASHGELTFAQVHHKAERQAVLAWIMDRKRERFGELGIADMFREAETRGFYRDLVAMPVETATMSTRIHILKCGEELVAANLGLFYQGSFYGLLIGTTNGQRREDQPGKHLFRMTVAACAEQGIRAFDAGVGNDSYKTRWCTRKRHLFHTLLPLTAAGRLYVLIASAKLRAKAYVKSTPRLWSAYRGLRRLTTGSPIPIGKAG